MFRSMTHQVGIGPIRLKPLIIGQDAHLFAVRLRDQQAIEGVFMVVRQFHDALGMSRRDVEPGEALRANVIDDLTSG